MYRHWHGAETALKQEPYNPTQGRVHRDDPKYGRQVTRAPPGFITVRDGRASNIIKGPPSQWRPGLGRSIGLITYSSRTIGPENSHKPQ